jgi:hypothetical protein
MMSMFAAMAFVRSMLAERNDDTEKAIAHMEHAIEMSPETRVLYRRLAHLTGQGLSVPPSRYIGLKPEYDLPRHDPANKFSQPGGTISLAKQVEALSAGEFILVTVMSAYRVNGPYVEGFQRAHTPLARLNKIFKEVHIITSWDKATSRDLSHWPAMEPKLSKSGVAVSVLFDELQSVGEQLSLISAPTNLIIDHRGHVVSQGWLGDDMMLWDALAKQSN